MAVYDARGGNNAIIDPVLTNISVGFPNNAFVAGQLTPEVKVRKQGGKYYIFGREGWVLEPGSDVRAPGSEAAEIPGLETSTDTYFCVEHSLQIAVTDEEREETDSPMAPDRDGTELVTSKLLLQRELTVRDIVQTAASYNAALTVTLAGTARFNDYVNSDPVGVFKTGRRAIHAKLFMEPTKTVIPWEVMSVMEDHPDFIERIKYSQMGVVTADIIGTVLGVSNIIVPGAGYNTSRMGQAEALAYVWGKDALMAHVPARAGLKIPAFMYEYVNGYGGRTQIVERWREDNRKSDVIRVSRRYDHKMMAVDDAGLSIAGYLMKTVID